MGYRVGGIEGGSRNVEGGYIRQRAWRIGPGGKVAGYRYCTLNGVRRSLSFVFYTTFGSFCSLDSPGEMRFAGTRKFHGINLDR